MVLLGTTMIGMAGDLPAYLYPDVSPSARAVDVIQSLKGFASRLSNYKGADTLVVSMVPFYQDAFAAVPTIQNRVPGNRPITCPAAEQDNEVGRLSKTYAEAARRDAAHKCAGYVAEARRERSTQQATEIAKLNAAIDRLTSLRSAGHCTAVNTMIHRAVREVPRGVAILISDLENDCPSVGVAHEPAIRKPSVCYSCGIGSPPGRGVVRRRTIPVCTGHTVDPDGRIV